MQCTHPSLPAVAAAAAAAAARGAYRATNSACPKAEQDPCKAVCNSFPLLPLLIATLLLLYGILLRLL